MWPATVRVAGLGSPTYVQRVGDGAPWILNQFQEQFGVLGRYRVDFYQVSGYLAAAATVIRPTAPAGGSGNKAGCWTTRRERSCEHGPRRGAAGCRADAGVRHARRDLSNWLGHLDYAGGECGDSVWVLGKWRAGIGM